MIQAIKITKEEFNIKEAEILAILKQFQDFTSERYQTNGIETTDGMVLLMKPPQEHFCKALDIVWQEFDKSIIKTEEL